MRTLASPKKEQPVNDGRKRIDILFRNASDDGFFSRLVHFHKVHCPYVHVECKNYSEDPANPELDQLTGRFSRRRGMFGILVCRSVADPKRLLKRLQDIAKQTEGVVIVLDDSDICRLIELKENNDNKTIGEFLDGKLEPILM
jgi:hypothetical protein